MQRQVFSRAGNNLKAGIVGLANVGKSTFFQALTKSSMGIAANYPFATIDPEKAVVTVPSERLTKLQQSYGSKKLVPANMTVFDIAGLVKGAHKGDGLGNAFLSHIRAVDGLYQMVRVFGIKPENNSGTGPDVELEVTHVEGSVDPVRDLDIILDELKLKDMEFVESHIERTTKRLKSASTDLQKSINKELELSRRLLQWLYDGHKVSTWFQQYSESQLGSDRDLVEREKQFIVSLGLLTAKPCVYIANISEEDYVFADNTTAPLDAIKQWVDKHSPGDHVIPVAVNLEHRLACELNEQEAKKEMLELEMQSALPSCIKEMRKQLGLISFFTCGPEEARQWTIQRGTNAQEAAGVIHGDLQKTFINAQIVKLEDALQCSDMAQLKAQGKVAVRGRDHEVEDGDVILFKSTAGKK